jgi:hypothetical protein
MERPSTSLVPSRRNLLRRHLLSYADYLNRVREFSFGSCDEYQMALVAWTANGLNAWIEAARAVSRRPATCTRSVRSPRCSRGYQPRLPINFPRVRSWTAKGATS